MWRRYCVPDNSKWESMCRSKARQLRSSGRKTTGWSHAGRDLVGWLAGDEPTKEELRGNPSGGPGAWWEVYYKTTIYFLTTGGEFVALTREWYEGPMHPDSGGDVSESASGTSWSHERFQMLKHL
jgi:hypothetical protein